MGKNLQETYKSDKFEDQTAGYIDIDGSFIYTDEYHGEESDEYKNLGLPEFSSTHYEDDTCVRIYKEPNEIQYKKLEEIIDYFLDTFYYCKVEIWDKPNGKYSFYNVYSLFEGACKDYTWNEKVGDWTGYKLVQIIKNNINKKKLKEELLLELNRNQLINKSKNSDNYKDTSKGRNRWERRNRSKIDRRVDQYNKIDMNTFFKKDELKIGINVHGETDDYIVTIRFNGALRAISDEIKRNNNKLEFKCVLIALQRTFNNGDVFVSCTCADWKYRQSYYSTRDGYNSGVPELRASNITNPHDTKGAGCKHINLVIGNIDWVMKIASVINNYIHYMEEHYQRLYADVIFPRLFNMPYQRAVQLNLFDTGTDELDSKEDEIKLSNRYGRDRTKFRSDVRINNMRNFRGPNSPKLEQHNSSPGQLKLFNNKDENNNKPFLQQNVSNNIEKDQQ